MTDIKGWTNPLEERVTYLDGDVVDEVVLGNANVHLECLSDSDYMLIVDNGEKKVHINIYNPSHKAKVIAKILESEGF